MSKQFKARRSIFERSCAEDKLRRWQTQLNCLMKRYREEPDNRDLENQITFAQNQVDRWQEQINENPTADELLQAWLEAYRSTDINRLERLADCAMRTVNYLNQKEE